MDRAIRDRWHWYARPKRGDEAAVCVGPITWARIHSEWPPKAAEDPDDEPETVQLEPRYTSAEMEAVASVEARRAEMGALCSAAQARGILERVAADVARLAGEHRGGSHATLRAEVSAAVTRALIAAGAEREG
jgi:hypothetical protein